MSGLVIDDLAAAILSALGSPTDKDGHPIAVTDEMKKYAKAVVDTLKAGVVSNLPGTVTATGAPGSPISDGAASGGLVAALLPATWLADLVSGFPTADAGQLSSEATASTGYLMGAARVAFASGKITGSCTATPTATGILLNGAGADGTIGALVGSAWASAVTGAIGGGGPLASPVYTTIAGYIVSNAKCAYGTGNVVGTFASDGGSLAAGAATLGTIA